MGGFGDDNFNIIMARTKATDKTEEATIDQIDAILQEKTFKGLHLGSRSGNEIIAPDIISTGSFFFDLILGGGFRASSWSRFYGPPESGKTSQGLCWAKQWQDFYGERGMVVVFNAEGRITLDLLQRSGVCLDKNRFRIIDTNKSDFIYTMIDRLVSDNPDKRVYYFMVDSTDACERTVDKDKTLGESEKIGGSATILSAAGKRLSLIFSVTGHHLYMSSQVRDKVNTHGPGAGGKQASGGNAPQFYSSLTGQIKKHWSEWSINENPSDPKSKEIGRLVSILLEKTPNERSGEVVQFPVKYHKPGGIWPEYEAMMICQAWNLLTEPKQASFEFDEKFLVEAKDAGVNLEKTSFRGKRQVLECFETNSNLVKYVHASMRKVCIS